ncbi:hypothetical protein [Erythrobacter crassostreae]|uniref:Uncharacterized protein n=1 Tax=Erythrobacter crassostreae TaxID=2828328 RepID=A0A9X1JMI2_9SPHN|nr:hypothetical protein [Erythrobacter crassostrea]MBV7259449.1 hypothetical protein [Erythrobacter crassostrea]
MERPAFGRRRTISARDIAEREAVVSEAPHRVIPEEVWEGEAGDALTEMGLHPDSPENQRPTQESANEKFEEEAAKQQAFLAQANAQMPEGVSVVAYAMLPWDLWNGRFGELLAMRCGLWAPQAWNQMLLAADEQSSVALGLPQHPGGYPEGLIEEIERLLDEAYAPIAGLMEKTRVQQNFGWQEVEAHDQAIQDLTQKIIAMSHYLGSMCIGEEAFNRHKEIFGMNIGWY